MAVHLILDALSVAAANDVSFHVNPAVKHPGNPVLLPGEPHQWDSLQVSWPGTVLYDADAGLFRCWYSGFDAVQSPERYWLPGYAESPDGIHWVKPELGQVTYLDRPTNQLANNWDGCFISTVFLNPQPDAPPSQRFGGYWMEVGRQADGGRDYGILRKGLAWSPDGISWTRAGTAYEGLPNDRVSFQDICQLLYDPDEIDPAFRIKGYSQILRTRCWDGRPNVRHIGLVHGADVDHVIDAADPVVLAPVEGIDEELHFASVKKIDDIFLMIFESDCFSRNPIHGDLRLAVSRDGRNFRRVHPTQPLVATGRKGMWDENLLVTTTSTIQEVGDEFYLFYFGCPNIYNSWPAEYAATSARRGSMFYPSYLGLATLPRDRYAYAQGPGTLITHEFNMNEDGLWLNADGDGITVTSVSATDGRVRTTGRLTSERRQTTYRKVGWNGTVPLGTCHCEISLSKSDRLYSLSY